MRRLVVLMCLLAGCGGGVSEEEFRVEANRVCKAGAETVDRIVDAELAEAKERGLDDQERYLRVVRALKPVVADSMERLEAVETPESARSPVEKLVKGVREGIELAERVGTGRGGLGDIQDSRRLEVLGVETRQAQQAAGLEDCVPDVVS